MQKAEKNENIYPTKKYKLSVCKICGHTVWTNIEEEMPDDYVCRFCKAPKKAFISFGTEAFNNVLHEFIHLADGIFYIKQNPPFAEPFIHNAYFIENEKGNILFDTPMFLNKSLLDEIEKRGGVKYIIHSHSHFLGASRLLCERFNSVSYLGKEEKPIEGNLNYPDYWMNEDRYELPDDNGRILIKKFPGHTPASYIMEIKRGKLTLLTGDSLYINCPSNTNLSNIFLFSEKENLDPEKLDKLYELNLDYIGTNSGFVKNAQYYLNQLKISEKPTSNPFDKKLKAGVLIDREDTLCGRTF
ncbi:MAG: MBL fold metallo-hydrolase [bacterium]